MDYYSQYINNKIEGWHPSELFYKLCAGYEPPHYEQHIKPKGVYQVERKIQREVTIKQRKYIATWMGKVPVRVIADQLGLCEYTIYNYIKKLKNK